jgi:hypothetical protein
MPTQTEYTVYHKEKIKSHDIPKNVSEIKLKTNVIIAIASVTTVRTTLNPERKTTYIAGQYKNILFYIQRQGNFI